jgi:DNA-binding transcriptional LysR family regulator
MLDLGKLATLRAVVTHGSFSAAAKALSLTQPAVSRQVSLLERRAGTQLVRRTQQGVHPTEAGRLLVEHADALLGRLALAEAQLADLAGLRRGHVRLGSFFTALVYLSAELGAILEDRHPQLFEHGDVIRDELVDRRTAFRRLTAGQLDVAIVFEHDFAPDPAPDGVELTALFDDPLRVLLPAGHPLAAQPAVAVEELARETWIRAHDGSAAQLVDHVLRRAGVTPPLLLAGRGDEPIEAQPLIAAGRGVTVAPDLNVILDASQVAVRRLAGSSPRRHVQAATARGSRTAMTRAVLDALGEIGADRARRLHAERP